MPTRIPSQFAVRVDRFTAAAVVRVLGEVDLATVAMLDRAIGDAFALEPQRLVVDLTRCGFLGAVGLTSLVRATRRGTRSGTSVMVAVDSTGSAHRAIVLTGLAEHLALIGYSPEDCVLIPT
ncbi:MAG: STAS domain-containing protein [Actinomycetota bacterium]|nr:STAS domain-containing protein [Actinomycetota bacterium]